MPNQSSFPYIKGFHEFTEKIRICINIPGFFGFITPPKSRKVKLYKGIFFIDASGNCIIHPKVGSPSLQHNHCFFSSAAYFITNIIVKNRTESELATPVVVDSSKITLNQLLNRTEEEYYVIATKSSLYENSYLTTDYINFYNEYINSYKQKEESLPFYYIDLDNALNKGYLGEELNIIYDIQTSDFYLPNLSIQPLVENAIKHGVSKKRGGGTVTISSYEDDLNYIISIIDTGVGLDYYCFYHEPG